MGLGIASVQNILELYNLGYLKNSKSIIEMGSQELHLKKEDLKQLFNNASLKDDLIDKIPNIKNWPLGPRSSSKYLYNSLGVEEYQCIDIGGQHNAICHDLNKPFEDKSKFNKFDVVTDLGACDCVFNVGECYKTMHKLTKPGGYIIIQQGVLKAFRYYLFDKSIFEGMAAANNYKIIFISYFITTGTKTENGSYHQFHNPANRSLFNTLDFARLENIGIYVVFQKQNGDEFKVPDSYYYSVKENYNFAGFNRMYFKDPLSYSYIPSATLTLEKAPAVLIIKALFKCFIKKIKRIIRIIIMKTK